MSTYIYIIYIVAFLKTEVKIVLYNLKCLLFFNIYWKKKFKMSTI